MTKMGNPAQKVVRTLDGKFNSIGDAKTQVENKAIMCRLVGEIGQDGYRTLGQDDRFFIDDCRFKIQQPGNPMFGWRQMEKIVALHTRVIMERAQTNAKRDGTIGCQNGA